MTKMIGNENGKRIAKMLEKFGNRDVRVKNGTNWFLSMYLEKDDDSIRMEIGTYSEYEGDLLTDPEFVVWLKLDKCGNVTEAKPTLYRKVTLYDDPVEHTRKDDDLDKRLSSFLDGITISGYLNSADIEQL